MTTKNADLPAMPFTAKPEYQFNHGGLTKREYFAVFAMQAMISNPHWVTAHGIASDAVAHADALLAELGKQP